MEKNQAVSLAAPLQLNSEYSVNSSGLKLKFRDKKIQKVENIFKYVGNGYVHAVYTECFVIEKNAIKLMDDIDNVAEMVFSLCLSIRKNNGEISTVSNSQLINKAGYEINISEGLYKNESISDLKLG